MHKNTHPEIIVDKNGRTMTVHKKNLDSARLDRVANKGGISRSKSSEEPIFTAKDRIAESSSHQQMTFDVINSIMSERYGYAKAIIIEEVDGRKLATGYVTDLGDHELNNFAINCLVQDAVPDSGRYRLSKLQPERASAAVDKMRKSERVRVEDDDALEVTNSSEGERYIYDQIAFNSTKPDDLRTVFSLDKRERILHYLAANSVTPADVAMQLASNSSANIRSTLATHSRYRDVVRMSAADPDVGVQAAAIARNPFSPDELDEVYRERRFSARIESAVLSIPDVDSRIINDIANHSLSTKNVTVALRRIADRRLARNYYPDDLLTDYPPAKSHLEASLGVKEYIDSVTVLNSREISGPSLGDDKARSIAWRIAQSTNIRNYPALHALSKSEPAPLQKIAEEAAVIANSKSLNFGSGANGHSYAHALFLWARQTQASRSATQK